MICDGFNNANFWVPFLPSIDECEKIPGDLRSKKFLLIPLNGNNHWRLIVVENYTKKIYFFDSISNEIGDYERKIIAVFYIKSFQN